MFNYEEYDAYESELKKKFPKIFANNYGGICIGKGWWPILTALCSSIQNHIDWNEESIKSMMKKNTHDVGIPKQIEQVIALQIKEKFGGFRFYYTGGNQKIDGYVEMAEAWANHTCEVCGNPGKSRDTHWIKTLCDVHYEEHKKGEKR